MIIILKLNFFKKIKKMIQIHKLIHNYNKKVQIINKEITKNDKKV